MLESGLKIIMAVAIIVMGLWGLSIIIGTIFLWQYVGGFDSLMKGILCLLTLVQLWCMWQENVKR